MDQDIIDNWADVKARQAEKRKANREGSAQLLTVAGVPFSVRNDGAHLIVEPPGQRAIDFWPGTGLWSVRGINYRRRGVYPLLSWIKAKTDER